MSYKLHVETVVYSKQNGSVAVSTTLLEFPSSRTRDQFKASLPTNDEGIHFIVSRNAFEVHS